MTAPVAATRITFFDDDIQFILERFADILRGNSYLSTGKYVAEFESRFAARMGTQHAVGCNSGTSALELIFRALGVSGREVILPSNTFIATANAVLNAGAVPVFADCGDDMCLDFDDVVRRITSRTAAIVPVHIGGLISTSVPRLAELCRDRGLHFVEDAAQAHGSALGGRNAGSFGTAAGFSFFSTKVMTTGEGGMVTTDDGDLAARMRSLREFGKAPAGLHLNYHTAIGYNWRMPEVAALLGLRQLEALDVFLERRRHLAAIYDEALLDVAGITIVTPSQPSTHNYFKYIVLLEEKNRDDVHRALLDRKIAPSGYVYEVPLHKQPVFPWAHDLRLPNTESVCARHLCLPLYYALSDDDARHVASTFRELLQ